ncbi:GntR family transcriptional regulator [Pseudonocardia endophytica]|uniref:GntR family transcriptional regulator n=1 Tax=Pseudonocardia endophytica TaxID=401976 RepID=UPI001404A852|nr:GntR family transcriptional regulator [Pseudonocardia endophytica]
MPVPSPRPSAVSQPHEVRRLRDLLRAAIAGGRFPDGRLPGEGELMVGFGASRSAVRGALSLLHDEGLVSPLTAPGTFRAVRQPRTLPAVVPTAASVHTRLLDRTGIAAPAPLAAWLGVPAGAPCLRIEFVTEVDGEPTAVETHYVLQPEAAELLGIPMRDGWRTLLDDAGLATARTEAEVDHLPADPSVAELLGVRPGSTVLAVEQTASDPDGRVFEAAVLRMRPGDAAPGDPHPPGPCSGAAPGDCRAAG